VYSSCLFADHELLQNALCSERALLNCLVANLKNLDADVLVGHNISGFDLDVLLHRLEVGEPACTAHLDSGWSLLLQEMCSSCSYDSNPAGDCRAAIL
jgi:hypothetical protein